MTKLSYPITLKRGDKLTMEQAEFIFIDPAEHEQWAEIKTWGPWNLIYSFKALCVCQSFKGENAGDITIYGYRKLQTPRQSGYEIEGYVSINNKRHSAFTSSHLFELENGHLIDVAIIFPRIK